MKPIRLATAPLLAGGLLIGLPAAPAIAAEPPPAEAPAADSVVSTSLPVFGIGIRLDVSLDAAGHLTEVQVLGAGGLPPDDIAATEVSPHEVKLVNTATGAEVQIETGTHKIQTKMETNSLADLIGAHTWSADLFGTGEVVIDFSIADDGSGTPTIDVTSAGGYEFAVRTETTTEDDEVEVEIEITGPDGATAWVKIGVEVEDEHGTLEAELKISARSELMFDGEHDSDVDDPTLNVPVDENYDDDHGDDDDHHDYADDDDEDDDDDDHDEDHHRNGDHDDHDDDD